MTKIAGAGVGDGVASTIGVGAGVGHGVAEGAGVGVGVEFASAFDPR